ncbi:DMT family transporter [Pseudaestuariivita sp.]|uniref:DMT family transporter n=1 Tax=Pseudaestuariivita sp. TaxID=2211669 RepID=UPI004058477C
MTAAPATPLRPRRAALAMLSAMAIVGLIDTTVVDIAKVMSVWQFFILRTALAAPLIVAIAWVWGARLRPERWSAVALRSMLIAAAMAFYFGALGFVPFAQALAGLFTAPIFVLLISAFVQGRAIGPVRIVAVAIGFAGVLLVLQPGDEGLHPAALVPMLGGLLYASGSVITRTLCDGEGTLSMLLGMFLAQALFGVVGLALTGGGDDFITRGWTWDIHSVGHWIVVQAVFSLVGVGLIIWAYQHGEASHVTVFEYTVLVFGPLVAWVAYGQALGPLGLLGIACIICAGTLIALRSRA